MNVGSIGYSISALAFFIFFVILFTDKHKGSAKTLLVTAALFSSIWALSMSYQAVTGSDLITPQIFEFLKSIAWITLLLRMLSVAYGAGITATGFMVAIGSIVVFVLIMTLPVLYQYVNDSITTFGDNFNYLLACHLLLAVIGIVLIEQLYRNTKPDQRSVIKFLCLGLGGMYIYDFYMYSDGLLYKRIDLTLWHARGFVDAMIVPLVGIAVIRDPLWSPEIFVSRKVVFHTTTLLASAVYLMTMGVAGYYVRDYGGSWGLVAQAFLLFFTVLSLLLLLFSQRIRARWKVLLNKHLYPYKYDYRDEWLRFIRTISSPENDQSFYLRTIMSIAQIIDSPGGMLWLRNDGHYNCVESYQMPSVSAKEASDSSLVKFLEENQFVISIDEFNQAPEVYNRLGNLDLPSWSSEVSAWLIVPLINIEKLIGFIVLNHSKIHNKHFNWEDSDLLNTVARQAALFIVQREVSEQLAEARQFESYNKLSTYMMHDMKNLVTQLSLITSNAEKHKTNPLFMDDVIKTISNSVDKMNVMMNMLQSKEVARPFVIVNIVEIMEELVINREKAGVNPIPTIVCESKQCNVRGDHEQLLSIFGHLVQNAQDATEDDGSIDILLSTKENCTVIEITDTGSGMTESFIKNELFKPFRTTKGKKGMGIGVYETREIILSLGGRIEVFSEVGKGTSFIVRIPVEQ